MLDHEIVFKRQVHEPHRFYNVQRSLMKGDSMFTRRKLFPIESHSVGSTQFITDCSFLQDDTCPRFHQRPVDLRLSIGNSCDDCHLDDNQLNLSLSIGMSSYKRSRISTKCWKNKIVYPSSPEIIDLEESTETESNEFLTNVVNSHQDHSMNSDLHQEWSTFNLGSNSQCDVRQTILMDFDLNEDQPYEPSFQSNESCGEYNPHFGQTSPKESQTKIYSIDLESVPESDLTEDNTDHTVQEAALSLLSISLQQTSPNNQDSDTKIGSNEIENIKEHKKKPIRSCSIDSYELLVLKLEESSVDEDSATSKAFKFNEFDQKGNGVKLRRGRRLKDFQKDVLPTISLLSNNEIWEDIKILEGVIRSREYKRLNKAKTCKGDNSTTPVKNKRSKVNYVSPKKKR